MNTLKKYLTPLFWSKVSVTSKPKCWMWCGAVDARGYGRISKRTFPVQKAHQMAFLLAAGKIPKGKHVLHKCNTPGCCNPFHLYTGTHQRNMADALRDGLFIRGEKRRDSKLTEAQVRAIRKKFRPYTYPLDMLAIDFGVSKSAIANVVYGTAWKWVK